MPLQSTWRCGSRKQWEKFHKTRRGNTTHTHQQSNSELKSSYAHLLYSLLSLCPECDARRGVCAKFPITEEYVVRFLTGICDQKNYDGQLGQANRIVKVLHLWGSFRKDMRGKWKLVKPSLDIGCRQLTLTQGRKPMGGNRVACFWWNRNRTRDRLFIPTLHNASDAASPWLYKPKMSTTEFGCLNVVMFLLIFGAWLWHRFCSFRRASDIRYFH